MIVITIVLNILKKKNLADRRTKFVVEYAQNLIM